MIDIFDSLERDISEPTAFSIEHEPFGSLEVTSVTLTVDHQAASQVVESSDFRSDPDFNDLMAKRGLDETPAQYVKYQLDNEATELAMRQCIVNGIQCADGRKPLEFKRIEPYPTPLEIESASAVDYLLLNCQLNLSNIRDVDREAILNSALQVCTNNELGQILAAHIDFSEKVMQLGPDFITLLNHLQTTFTSLTPPQLSALMNQELANLGMSVFPEEVAMLMQPGDQLPIGNIIANFEDIIYEGIITVKIPIATKTIEDYPLHGFSGRERANNTIFWTKQLERKGIRSIAVLHSQAIVKDASEKMQDRILVFSIFNPNAMPLRAQPGIIFDPAVRLIPQITRAVAELHTPTRTPDGTLPGIHHADLHPGNILREIRNFVTVQTALVAGEVLLIIDTESAQQVDVTLRGIQNQMANDLVRILSAVVADICGAGVDQGHREQNFNAAFAMFRDDPTYCEDCIRAIREYINEIGEAGVFDSSDLPFFIKPLAGIYPGDDADVRMAHDIHVFADFFGEGDVGERRLSFLDLFGLGE